MNTYIEFIRFLEARRADKLYRIDNDKFQLWCDAVEANSSEFAIGTSCQTVLMKIDKCIKLFGPEWKQDVEQFFKDNLESWMN